MRRLTIDLTGLPPSIEEITQFEQTAATDLDLAITQAVERLLASPAYGEQMALAWLDAARYADSYGYQSDQLNTQWPYRDWVVRSFNSNLPFDEFLTWQLAGDLLENPTRDQILATAFNRLHRLTNEGGSIPQEWLAENAADRVQTFGTAILGLTIECARCHDHKFDPITARDYYSLSAFFNSIDESGMYDSTEKVPTPSLLLPTDEQHKALAQAEQNIATAEAALIDEIAAAETRLESWLKIQQPELSLPDPIYRESFEGHLRVVSADRAELQESADTKYFARVPGVAGGAVGFYGDYGAVADAPGMERSDAFTIDLWFRDTACNPLPVVLLHKTQGTDVGFSGFDVLLTGGHVELRIYRVWPGNGIGIRTREPFAKGEWQHLAITYDGSSHAGGLGIHLAGKPVTTEILRDHLYKSTVEPTSDNVKLVLGTRFRDRGFKDGEFDELQLFGRALTPLEIDAYTPTSMLTALADPTANRAARAYYVSA